MSQTAKLFVNGHSQAVRLPAAFRFDTQEVFIRKDPITGDVILSRRPDDWNGFLIAAKNVDMPEDFLSATERMQHDNSAQERDPLDCVPSFGH